MTKLWAKNKTAFPEMSRRVEIFTADTDRQMDLKLAYWDVFGSKAHARMLGKCGLISEEDAALLEKGLEEIERRINEGSFVIEDGVEDVHSQVELLLTRALGETGKRIHTARSRNDQVLTDIKLFLKNELHLLVKEVETLARQLLRLSEENKDTLLPGYTHFQVAMPSSFGLWFGAYAESFSDDLLSVAAAYRLANKNPLGSAAGYGSSFPIDRELTTGLLGFADLHWNSVYAQMSRGKTEKSVAVAFAAVAATLGRMATDLVLFLSQNFGFVSFPEELTTGSSIMPHKKNPDVFELIRARCSRIQALPNEIALVTANLPSGYHRDFQILKEHLFPASEDLRSCLSMTAFMLEHIRIGSDITSDPRYRYLFSVEAVNRLVKTGIPFREAYVQVGRDIASGSFVPDTSVEHTHQGSIGHLCNDKIEAALNTVLEEFVPFPFSPQSVK
jgi:argininosuccinate lyase